MIRDPSATQIVQCARHAALLGAFRPGCNVDVIFAEFEATVGIGRVDVVIN